MREARRPIIVTGGSRGIGAATVRRLVALAHPVLFGYRSDEGAANALVDELVREHGLPAGRVTAVRCDLATEAGVNALFAASDMLGDEHGALAGLIVNAGIVSPKSRVVDMDVARIERVLALNVTGDDAHVVLALDLEVPQRRHEPPGLQLLEKVVEGDLDRQRVGAAAIDDARHHAAAT